MGKILIQSSTPFYKNKEWQEVCSFINQVMENFSNEQKVTEKTFTLYLKFLETKYDSYLLSAEREG